jgi:hypothetical protein
MMLGEWSRPLPDTPGNRRGRSRGLQIFVALAAAMVATLTVGWAALSAATSAEEPDGAKRTVFCTFTNPAYSGECVESTEILEDSTATKACQAILDCLNNPRCVTTYCNASTVRSGWVLKRSEEK